MQRGSCVRSLIFFIVDNCLEGLTVISIIGAIIFLNIWGALLSIPIIIVAWLLFNVIEIRETLLQIEENTRGGLVISNNLQEQQPQPQEKKEKKKEEKQSIYEEQPAETDVVNCNDISKIGAFGILSVLAIFLILIAIAFFIGIR